jgi:hypothetical protein
VAGGEVNYSNHSSAKIKNDWENTSTPTVCLHRVGRDSFISDA